MSADRLKQLHDLVRELEALPPSEQRDHVLGAVRSRAVDVDTGVMPRAIRPAAPADPAVPAARAAPLPAPALAVPSKGWHMRLARPIASTFRAPPPTLSRSIDLLLTEGRLCLEDLQASEATPSSPALGMWHRGLRG